MIGSGAVILDNASIGEESIVAAQSLVRVGFRVPAGTLVAGVPAEVKRELSPSERAAIRQSAQSYTERAASYRTGLRAAQYRPPAEEAEEEPSRGRA